jgi:hypothetical protein
MSAFGLTRRHRSGLASTVVVSLVLGTGAAGAWEASAGKSPAPQTSPQLAGAKHPSCPAVADGTRKSSADSVNLLPKWLGLASRGYLKPAAGEALAVHSSEPAIPRGVFSAAAAIRAPPDDA